MCLCGEDVWSLICHPTWSLGTQANFSECFCLQTELFRNRSIPEPSQFCTRPWFHYTVRKGGGKKRQKRDKGLLEGTKLPIRKIFWSCWWQGHSTGERVWQISEHQAAFCSLILHCFFSRLECVFKTQPYSVQIWKGQLMAEVKGQREERDFRMYTQIKDRISTVGSLICITEWGEWFPVFTGPQIGVMRVNLMVG